MCLSEAEKAQEFAEFFKTVYKSPFDGEQDGMPESTPFLPSSLEYVEVTSQLVYETLTHLPSRTSSSPNEILYTVDSPE